MQMTMCRERCIYDADVVFVRPTFDLSEAIVDSSEGSAVSSVVDSVAESKSTNEMK
jgi:hypothetical protein